MEILARNGGGVSGPRPPSACAEGSPLGGVMGDQPNVDLLPWSLVVLGGQRLELGCHLEDVAGAELRRQPAAREDRTDSVGIRERDDRRGDAGCLPGLHKASHKRQLQRQPGAVGDARQPLGRGGGGGWGTGGGGGGGGGTGGPRGGRRRRGGGGGGGGERGGTRCGGGMGVEVEGGGGGGVGAVGGRERGGHPVCGGWAGGWGGGSRRRGVYMGAGGRGGGRGGAAG